MLSVEPMLIDRLSQVPGLRGVYGTADMLSVDQAAWPSPCIYVAFDGYRPVESSPQGKSARIEARWLVVLSVRQLAKAADGRKARADVAPLIDAVLAALMGWVPAGHTPFVLSSAPGPEFAAGQLLFPLAFTTQQVVRSS